MSKWMIGSGMGFPISMPDHIFHFLDFPTHHDCFLDPAQSIRIYYFPDIWNQFLTLFAKLDLQ